MDDRICLCAIQLCFLSVECTSGMGTIDCFMHADHLYFRGGSLDPFNRCFPNSILLDQHGPQYRLFHYRNDLFSNKLLLAVVLRDLGRGTLYAEIAKIDIEFIGRFSGLREIVDSHDSSNSNIYLLKICKRNLFHQSSFSSSLRLFTLAVRIFTSSINLYLVSKSTN